MTIPPSPRALVDLPRPQGRPAWGQPATRPSASKVEPFPHGCHGLRHVMFWYTFFIFTFTHILDHICVCVCVYLYRHIAYIYIWYIYIGICIYIYIICNVYIYIYIIVCMYSFVHTKSLHSLDSDRIPFFRDYMRWLIDVTTWGGISTVKWFVNVTITQKNQ